jgi:glutamate N-acetyltransferase/amino-acid N-acetyltransferase
VGHSTLVKTAMYGRDANWGRIVAALGRSGAQFDPDDVVVTMCGVELFRNGQPTDADFDTMLEPYLKEVDIVLDIELGHGDGAYTLLASDLTHKYIDINADYRS